MSSFRLNVYKIVEENIDPQSEILHYIKKHNWIKDYEFSMKIWINSFQMDSDLTWFHKLYFDIFLNPKKQ